MRAIDFCKNLIIGFWKNGFIQLCKIISEHWIISLLIISLIAYLCSNSKTAIYVWFIIGAFAIYCAIKAILEIFIEIIYYINSKNPEDKTLILQKKGGKIFDLLLCVVGIFQALRIFNHISKITKSTSSAVSVVDDVAGAISKFIKDLKI